MDTLVKMNKSRTVYVPFRPLSKKDDDERMVWGYVSTESWDSDGQRMKKETVEKAWPKFMEFANVREMHSNSAAGKVLESEAREKGRWIGVHVSDDQAWRKVKDGTYNGFSLGGKILETIGEWITEVDITEVSLVDRPADPEAVFVLWKRDKGKPKQENKMELVSLEPALTKMMNAVLTLGKNFKYTPELKKSMGNATSMLGHVEDLCKMRDAMSPAESKEMDTAIQDYGAPAGKNVVEQMGETASKMSPIVVENEGANLEDMSEDMDKLAKSADALIKRGAIFGKKFESAFAEGWNVQGWNDQPLRYQDEGETWTTGKMSKDLRKGEDMDPEKKEEMDKGAGGEGEGWPAFQKMMDEEQAKKMEGIGEEDAEKCSKAYGRKMAFMKKAYEADDESMDKMGDHMDKMDADPDKELGKDDDEPKSDLNKMAGARDTALARVAGLTNDLTQTKETLNKRNIRIAELEGELAPTKIKSKAVALAKGEDIGDKEVSGLGDAQTEAEESGDARALIKMAHQGTLNTAKPLAKRKSD